MHSSVQLLCTAAEAADDKGLESRDLGSILGIVSIKCDRKFATLGTHGYELERIRRGEESFTVFLPSFFPSFLPSVRTAADRRT